MAKRIIAYIIFCAGILSYFIYVGYYGSFIFLPEILFAVTLILLFIGMRLLVTTRSIKEIKYKNREARLIQELKETGEKVKVDFSQCEVKSNDYSEERELYAYDPRVQMLNALTDPTRNTEVVELHQSVLVLKKIINGKEETFVSPVIRKDRITLMFQLSEKKETTLYVDRNDRSRYCLNLEFLQR